MPKAQRGWRKLSGSAKRKIEKILAQGDRYFYRQFNSASRRKMKGADHVA